MITKQTFEAVINYQTFYEDHIASLSSTTARSVVECGSFCTDDDMCVGIKFNEATLTCEFYKGCLTISDTKSNKSNKIKVYVQQLREDLALGKFLSREAK